MMNSYFVMCVCVFVVALAIEAEAQQESSVSPPPTGEKVSGVMIPSVSIKNLQRQNINTHEALSNNGKPIVLNFWATWCKPCIVELSTWSTLYDEWRQKWNAKIVAVSIDDVRNSSKVAPFVRSRSWEFDIFLDENGDFRRAMNVNPIPHTFILNGKGEIVWQHISFAQGDEEEIARVLQTLSEGKTP